MDTDAFFLNIKTNDVYEDIENILDEFDTSDYPKDHPLYSETNKKVIGRFKDEPNGTVIKEAVFIRSKQYAFKDMNNKEKKKLKGISKVTIDKDINFKQFI